MTEPVSNALPPLPLPETPKPSRLHFEPSAPVWWYIVRMGAIAFSGAMLVSIVLGNLISGPDLREEIYASEPWLFMVEALVIAPPLETLIMAFFFFVGRFITKNQVRLAFACAVFWGLLHLLNSPVNGIAVLWPFYIMSRAYLAWRPLGFWKAFGVTTLIHAANNTIPALVFVMFVEQPASSSEQVWAPVHVP